MAILDTLHDPAQLRGMSANQLEELADELRTKMIRTVSQTGGHLASSLGTVELTLALHRVMDSPRDRIVWDTGHQAYAHKLLTGRAERFETLRQLDGVGGFPRRTELVPLGSPSSKCARASTALRKGTVQCSSWKRRRRAAKSMSAAGAAFASP